MLLRLKNLLAINLWTQCSKAGKTKNFFTHSDVGKTKKSLDKKSLDTVMNRKT